MTEAIHWTRSRHRRITTGASYWHAGNRDRATADFNEAIRLDPKLGVAYYVRGCACLYYGQKVKAEMDFARAKSLGYTSPKPRPTNIIQKSLSIPGGAAVAINILSSRILADLPHTLDIDPRREEDYGDTFGSRHTPSCLQIS